MGLQMKIQEKIGVGVAMSMGLFELAIWGTCESGVTIMAASIPVLRVLVRDVASTARKYYGSSGTRTSRSRFGPGDGMQRSNTVTVTTSMQKGSVRRKWDKLADDRSDKSILGAEPELEFGKIVRTNEIVVQYDTRSEIEGKNGNFEMHQMGRRNPSHMV
ncbi:integral membrane protein [Colletotrichum tofieldiae]|nr:integral membrane protein [Colletotrichum tofieldiae]